MKKERSVTLCARKKTFKSRINWKEGNSVAQRTIFFYFQHRSLKFSLYVLTGSNQVSEANMFPRLISNSGKRKIASHNFYKPSKFWIKAFNCLYYWFYWCWSIYSSSSINIEKKPHWINLKKKFIRSLTHLYLSLTKSHPVDYVQIFISYCMPIYFWDLIWRFWTNAYEWLDKVRDLY